MVIIQRKSGLIQSQIGLAGYQQVFGVTCYNNCQGNGFWLIYVLIYGLKILKLVTLL